MAVSLKQIAQESKLSIPTVSRVLRGEAGFSEETRKRVMEVANRLRYRPNMLVHGLQTGRSGTIGVMVPPLDSFLSEILIGIHQVLASNNHAPLLLWPEADLPEREQLHRLVDRRVEGVILFPNHDAAPDAYLAEVWDRGLPLVTVDRQMPNTHADFVGTDDSFGAEAAAKHLLDLGHRNFVHLTACPTISTAKRRWEAFEGSIRGVNGAKVRRIVADDFRSGLGPAKECLRTTDRPTAIFAANDILAVAVLDAADSLGLKVPDDLSVIGYADLDVAKVAKPALTTLRQDPRHIGETAAQIMLDRLEGRITRSSPMSVLDRPTLVVRESTGACA
jgi:LacI family transcriptional regulator, galactose operon repressor